MAFLKRIVIFVILSLLIAFSVPAFAEYMIGILATDLKTHSINENILSTYPLKNHYRKTVTLAFTGDIMMETNYPDKKYLMDNGGKKLFKDVSPILNRVDAAFGNLEGVLMDHGGDVKKCKNPDFCFAFRTPIHYVTNLVRAGFDAMSIAKTVPYSVEIQKLIN